MFVSFSLFSIQRNCTCTQMMTLLAQYWELNTLNKQHLPWKPISVKCETQVNAATCEMEATHAVVATNDIVGCACPARRSDDEEAAQATFWKCFWSLEGEDDTRWLECNISACAAWIALHFISYKLSHHATSSNSKSQNQFSNFLI